MHRLKKFTVPCVHSLHHFRMEEQIQSAPSEVVSQGLVPVLESDPVSQHGMETVQQQVADTEDDREMGEVVEGEGEGREEGEGEMLALVESSENLQPSTSHEVVKPVSVPVEQEVMEGGDEVRVVAADEQLVEPLMDHTQKPVDQVLHHLAT